MNEELIPLFRTTGPAWSLIRSVGHALQRELTERGHDGLRPVHLGLCGQILQGRTRVAEIAPHAMVTKQALSLLIKELEASGYLERSVDPDDRRARIISLTQRGMAAATDAVGIMATMQQAWLDAVGPDRLEDCQRTLRELAEVFGDQPAG